jgi:nucleotide-binding universal stress UspA family protein
MFSLTVGQAAGALAATTVAAELDLIGASEVNAVVLVILASAFFAGFSADRFGPRDRGARPHRRARSGPGSWCPVANPQTVASLVRVAAQVAAADSGAVVAVNVLPLDARPDQIKAHRDLATAAEKVALGAGSEVQTSVRIDSSTTGGVLHTVVEQQGTALVMGWKGYANKREDFFGAVIDQIVGDSPVPVLVCRPGDDDRTERVVVVVTRDDVGPGQPARHRARLPGRGPHRPAGGDRPGGHHRPRGGARPDPAGQPRGRRGRRRGHRRRGGARTPQPAARTRRRRADRHAADHQPPRPGRPPARQGRRGRTVIVAVPA